MSRVRFLLVVLAAVTAAVAAIALAGPAEDAPVSAAVPDFDCDIDGDGLAELFLDHGIAITQTAPGVFSMVQATSGRGSCHDLDSDGRPDLAIVQEWDSRNGNLKNVDLLRIAWGGPTGVDPTSVELFGLGAAGMVDRERSGTDLRLESGDFDGDGENEIVVGLPLDDDSRGAVIVAESIDGGAAGPVVTLTQATPGIAGVRERLDRFGQTVAAGDFDGDGFDDLVVGVPFEVFGSAQKRSGLVHVIPGSSSGLAPQSSTTRHQGSPGVATANEEDAFGEALTVGDFNGDGFDDLAVGVPQENLDGRTDVGIVNVLVGSPGGLTGVGGVALHQNAPDIGGVEERLDMYGATIASGDLNADGFDDLVIGVPGEDIGDIDDVGMVNIVYGSASGLDRATNENFHPLEMGATEKNWTMGSQIDIGDLNGDGYDDVVAAGWSAADRVSFLLLGGPQGVALANSSILEQAPDP